MSATVREVAPGVHLVSHAHVNCYLVEDDDGVTLVDAGLPSVWRPLGWAIRAIGHRPRDLRALVLTHAHFDHVGVVRRLQQRLALPVWATAEEHSLVSHPYSYAHENPRALYPVRHPAAVPILTRMALAGALTVRGATGIRTLATGTTLDVPGRPEVLATPGHTYGHVALHLRDRDVVISGDALVTLDPYTARTGPRIIAGAATADFTMNLATLDAIAGTGAGTVLPGHGEPWTQGAAAAVERARAAGTA
ncbi:MBL fold metallo-hydrolase [Georgenia sp. H159]|uniref:MBL fold metallo-hydrolase n=1 Tax=Georgenia sp. H159 TaxID=3076115 RepID=UPI002D78E8ED|nr:MBL fold metallo-hydrolase [Georgenia sp. H159]